MVSIGVFSRLSRKRIRNKAKRVNKQAARVGVIARACGHRGVKIDSSVSLFLFQFDHLSCFIVSHFMPKESLPLYGY